MTGVQACTRPAQKTRAFFLSRGQNEMRASERLCRHPRRARQPNLLPVADLRGEPVAAVSICIGAESLSDAQIRAYSGPLIQAARQLAARIA